MNLVSILKKGWKVLSMPLQKNNEMQICKDE